jgi:hypothetical protein
MGGYLGKGERPCGTGVRRVHFRMEDEFWGIDRGIKVEKRKIRRQLERLC